MKPGMTQTVEVLVLDLLEWLARRERSYHDRRTATEWFA
jgi:hypothetical protein